MSNQPEPARMGAVRTSGSLASPTKFVDDAGGYEHHRWGYHGSIDARHDDAVYERVAHHFPKSHHALAFLQSRSGRHMADAIHHLPSGHKDVPKIVDQHVGWHKKHNKET